MNSRGFEGTAARRAVKQGSVICPWKEEIRAGSSEEVTFELGPADE